MNNNILCKDLNNDSINLTLLFEILSHNVPSLLKYSNRLFLSMPEGQVFVSDSVNRYRDLLPNISIDSGIRETASLLGLKSKQVLQANQVSILVLFTYSHYLQIKGFNIENPTNFEEVNSKLAFCRQTVANVGFYLISQKNVSLSKKTRFPTTDEIFHRGAKVGITLGYITIQAHRNGVEKAVSLILGPD